MFIDWKTQYHKYEFFFQIDLKIQGNSKQNPQKIIFWEFD